MQSKWMKFPGREIAERVRKEYPVGTRVELVEMADVEAPPAGTRGTVCEVDDTATLLVRWDDGSNLGVIHDVDVVRKVTEHD